MTAIKIIAKQVGATSLVDNTFVIGFAETRAKANDKVKEMTRNESVIPYIDEATGQVIGSIPVVNIGKFEFIDFKGVDKSYIPWD